MYNMSYCRWENTAGAMSECVNSIEHVNEDGVDSLSATERSGMRQCARMALEMLENLPASILVEADIDLNRLPDMETLRRRAELEPA